MDTASYDMSDLLGMVRRHWWIVALLTMFGVVGGFEYNGRQPKVYESATSVLVQPTGAGQDTNVAGGRTRGEINLDTEAQLVRSTAVAAQAAQLLRATAPPDNLAGQITVEVPPNTSVLVIKYRAADPRVAQAGSHAFAEAYLRNRQDTAAGELAEQVATVDGKLKQLNAALVPINVRLALIRSDSPERPSLESQRASITAQVNTLSARLNQLTTTTVSAGKIIRDARLPARPIKPVLPVNLGGGAALGLLAGVAATLLRERLDSRVRRPGDLIRRCDVPVLAFLPPKVRPRLDDVFPPFGAGGRMFNRLRNEVVASGAFEAAALVPAAADPPAGGGAAQAAAVRVPRPRMGQVIVVAGANRGSASTVVAANLAAAFARTGGRTVLVCAHLPDSVAELAPAARLLGVRAVPGLSDVLAGRVPLSRALQRAPRQPRLSVITTGGTASAGGLLQSQTLRDTLVVLRRQAEYVVIEAPATSTSADAQSVASLADIALVAIELRRSRYVDVMDAAEQLRRVGTPLLGAVVLPRLVRRGDEPPPSPVNVPGLAADDDHDYDHDHPLQVHHDLDFDGDPAHDAPGATREPAGVLEADTVVMHLSPRPGGNGARSTNAARTSTDAGLGVDTADADGTRGAGGVPGGVPGVADTEPATTEP